MTFYSPRGLGHSIVAFPVFHALRRTRPVRVVAFENGGADFYRAFHDDVVGVRSNTELMKAAWNDRGAETFVCYPTRGRELAVSVLSRAKTKFVVRPAGAWRVVGGTIGADPAAHDLDNTRRLLATVPGCDGQLETGPQMFGLPTAAASGPAVGRRLGVHAVPSGGGRSYPVAFWTDVLDRLGDQFDRVQMFSGADSVDIARGEAIRDALPPGLRARVSLEAGLGFAALTAQFASLTQFIGGDAAPMHLAALLGRPTVALWSSADVRRVYPYGSHVRTFVPRETAEAREFAFSDEIPANVARARAADVVQLIESPVQSTFTIARERGTPVGVHVY